jgi:hypothetical protein
LPKFNNFVFFEVMGKSFHQVSVLISMNIYLFVMSVYISVTDFIVYRDL